MKNLSTLLLCTSLFSGFASDLSATAQDPERQYLSAVLQPTTKKQAAYYRLSEGQVDDRFLGKTYALDGTLKAEGRYVDEALTIEDGTFIFYHPNGSIESRGEYIMGLKTGTWQRFDQKGLALAEKIYDPEPLANIVYTRAQTMPRSKEGDERQLVRYIKESVGQIEGKRRKEQMTACFIVEKDGSLSDLKVVDGTDATVNERVTEAIRSTGPWAPGVERGQPVRVQVRLPLQL